MKVKEFELAKGPYAVVATYTHHDDVSGEDEEKKISTHARPRPRLYTDMATLTLAAREFFGLGELKLTMTKITFSENDDGRFVRVGMQTEGEHWLRISPGRIDRKPDMKVGEDTPDPDSLKNIFLEAVDLVENRISEYLGGDREQPELPPAKPEPEAKQGKLKLLGGSVKAAFGLGATAQAKA